MLTENKLTAAIAMVRTVHNEPVIKKIGNFSCFLKKKKKQLAQKGLKSPVQVVLEPTACKKT